jgi:histidinol phosphatase-like PHP family hydrolase
MLESFSDFHSHTFLSDGELSPIEHIRRAAVRGYRAVGITDHAGPGNVEWIVDQLVRDCALCERYWDIVALPGVELTHLPPAAIPLVARMARAAGAKIVVVHGETLSEPVEPGTNLAAVSCPDVDLLGHPGLVTPEEAAIAARTGVFLELTVRRGHCLGNGHVAAVARAAGARLVVSSDAHAPGDFLSRESAMNVALGAGLDLAEARVALGANAAALLLRAQGGARL